MSWAWIIGVRLGASYSRRAFLTGISALLIMPILGVLDSKIWSLETPKMLATMALIEIAFIFPSVALAAYLNLFHAASDQPSST